jgi:hypothetical protein
MERRSLLCATLLALLVLTPALWAAAASPPPALACIKVADGQAERTFDLIQTLDFLRQGYTDPQAVTDPLPYARDLCLRGKLLAYFLKHSQELTQSGFFEARDAAARHALLASLDPEFVSPELAASLTPKDILALHAVVYVTAAPAAFDELLRCRVAASNTLEGRDYAYLTQLKQAVLEASEQIGRVQYLSGMCPEAQGEIRPACAASAAAAPQGEHKCTGACQSEGGKCSGTCAGEGGKCSGKCQGGSQGEHKCTGSCKSEGGKCSGSCAGEGGKCSGKCQGGSQGEHKCTGACQSEGGKCSGTCAGEGGKCPGKCQGGAPATQTGLEAGRTLSALPAIP